MRAAVRREKLWTQLCYILFAFPILRTKVALNLFFLLCSPLKKVFCFANLWSLKLEKWVFHYNSVKVKAFLWCIFSPRETQSNFELKKWKINWKLWKCNSRFEFLRIMNNAHGGEMNPRFQNKNVSRYRFSSWMSWIH